MSSASKSQIIVLHLTKFGDSGAVVHAIDSLFGRRSLLLRGIGKGKKSAVTSQFHPLSVLEVVAADSQKSSISYLREFTPLFSLEGIRSDIYKNSVALFMAEVIYRSFRNEDGDAELFRWFAEAVVAIDGLEGSCANFHLWFLVGYAVKLGFRPQDNWSGDSVFDIVSARFLPSEATVGIVYEQGRLFSREESELLHKFLTMSREESLSIPLSAKRRNAFARKMLDYLSYHLGATLDIRSLDVLHDIFA